jgi:hypothetical protein
LTGSGLTLGALAALVRRGVRQLAVADAYREVAQRLGLVVDTRGVSIRGHLGERRIWVGEVLDATTVDRRSTSRGVVGFERPLGLGLRVEARPRRWRRSAPGWPIGDATLEEALRVSGDDQERIRALFGPPVRDALGALVGRWPDLRISDDELMVVLPAPEADAEALVQLVDRLVAAASAFDDARRAVPCPSAVEPFAERLAALAAEPGFEFEPWMPAIGATLEGHAIRIEVRRELHGYAAAVCVQFQPHPPLGLLVRPQLEPDGYWSVGQDIQLGDPAFDAAFVVKGYDPRAVRARLADPVRARWVAMAQVGSVVADDRALTITGLPLDLPRLRALAQTAAESAAAMGW